MEIILAKEKELNSIYGLARRCIIQMRAEGIEQWDEFYPNIYTFEKDIEEKSLFVCRDDRALIGCIVINERQEPEYQQVDWEYRGKVCVVHRLMVDPVYQGRGIAKELMHFAEYLAKEREYQVIRLDAFSHNSRALRFYRHLSYREAGQVSFRKGKFICFEKKLN
jgi:ribosomal protein S18 acetylase RimI-like enzyme